MTNAQRIAMWAREAGLDDKARKAFLLAWSEGEISSAKDVSTDLVELCRRALNALRAGEVRVGVEDGNPKLIPTAVDAKTIDEKKARAETVTQWCADAGFATDDERHAFLTACDPNWTSAYDVSADRLVGFRKATRGVEDGKYTVVDGVLTVVATGLVYGDVL